MTAASPTLEAAAIKILVVDDHPLFREALVGLIRAVGWQVEILEAVSLAAATLHAAANPDVALAILDLTLPDAAGIEAVERLLRERPELPVLVLSAADDPSTVRAALEAGARAFISKRSPTRVLADAIKRALADVSPKGSQGHPASGPETPFPPKQGA